jgi:hypothetical protein
MGVFAACSPYERGMPRRRPARLRAQVRLPAGGERIPGLSPYGHVVVARLEHARLGPGRTASALRHWRNFVRDPGHRLYDPSYEGCGVWECCPDMIEVRRLLEIVACHLPRRDARRFRALVAEIDADW